MPDDEEPHLNAPAQPPLGDLAALGAAPHPVPPAQPPLGDLAALGAAPHPVPIQEGVSYTIILSPPNGELIAFSSDDPRHTPERYDGAQFSLGPDGTGSFRFMETGTSFDIHGSGTRTAAEDTVEFRAAEHGLSGIFCSREGTRGERSHSHTARSI